MSKNYSFRRMRSGDKEPLIAIVKKIWGGHDFVPMMFDEWVKDDKGEFTAIELDGKLVGCAKLTFITDTDAWLQALRKDIDLDLKGVAKAVTEYQINKLRNRGNITSLRFTTYFKNYASIESYERTGFRVVKEL